MYQTETMLRRTLRVRYPAGRGRVVLRTELDWDRDLAPVAVDDTGETWTFELEARRPFLYFKPCLVDGETRKWSVGANYLVLMTHQGARDVYPFFDGSMTGRITDVIAIDSAILGRPHRLRAYLPPGYEENSLKRYPVVFMQDGKNLFFPDEAFGGAPWGVDGTLALLDEMQAVDKTVIVGLHSDDRMNEYTKPGYEAYGRAVVGELVPAARRRLRLVESSRATAVMGSSLGGVVSFYMALEWPEVFGVGLCLSSTFAYRDDLLDRVLTEPKRSSKFYLDSGWPGDNYEVTLAMAMALAERGYVPGRDYVHFAFPLEGHSEAAWGGRLHLPLQLFWSRVGTSYRETLA